MSAEHPTIAAVVATFNRKESLLRCIDALKNQTALLDSIYVVDNASTDGTAELLSSEGLIDKIPQTGFCAKSITARQGTQKNIVFCYLKMPENTGGAGAFHEGLKRAYLDGFDWIWLLDDDGLPDKDALEKLLIAEKQTHGFVYNSITSAADRTNLAIPFTMYKGRFRRDGYTMIKTIRQLQDTGLILIGQPNFFNGSLIHKQVISSVGLPEKNFFIWGDEVEYCLRIQQAGYKTYTVTDSILVHPVQKSVAVRFFGKTFRFTPLPPWKLYYAIRNSIIVDRKYGLRRFPLIRFCLKCAKNAMVTLVFGREKLKALRCLTFAFKDGLFGRLGINKEVM